MTLELEEQLEQIYKVEIKCLVAYNSHSLDVVAESPRAARAYIARTLGIADGDKYRVSVSPLSMK